MRVIRADLLLLIVALIWGVGFVVQRTAMEAVGPMTFTGLRFLIGAAVLLPFISWGRVLIVDQTRRSDPKAYWSVMLIAALAMAAGGILQQAGLVHTSAGVAGFITGLYVIIVPLLGLFIGYLVRATTWIAAGVATAGLYLLSVQGQHAVNPGDWLVLGGTVGWSIQLLAIGWLAKRGNPVTITAIMALIAGAVTIAIALPVEQPSLTAIRAVTLELLYSGPLAVGVAFLLQVVAQRDAPPAHTAVLIAMESVFGALAGWLYLNELLTRGQIVGCVLMFVGIVLAQLKPPRSLESQPTDDPVTPLRPGSE
ncbi:MAG: DMT family transporter [Phycisphaerales bacterium]|nr:DMT family transporter [Phycisphaerales bacterium]